MRLALTLHPDCRCDAVDAIEVELSPGFALRYIVSGDVAALLIPEPAAPLRTDGLWQHTCFELFARGGGEAYREVNLSPSGEWAAYAFSSYRDGMRNAELAPPRIATARTAHRFELRTQLDLGDAPMQLGLSAVIEEAGGRKSYWALAHPPGRPDFHHGDCFALQLPAADRG